MRRSAKEPCQYITGRTEFMGLQIKVTPDTLIPRPETELIVEEVIGRFSRVKERTQDSASPLILDLCTGSGCLAVAVAVLLPGVRLVATDLSAAALEVARENARSHNVESSIEFLPGDLFNALRGGTGKTLFKAGFDLIISNPPYINSFDLAGLQREVIGHEPLSALDGGRDGLDIIREIITEAPAHLKPGAELIMEIGYDQAAPVTALLKASKYRSFSIKKDFSGIDRMVVATTRTKE